MLLASDAHTTEDSDTLSAEKIIAFYNETLNGFWAGERQVRVQPASEIHFAPQQSFSMTPGGTQMDPLWNTALWQQFGATIDMLENALLACPSTHWNGHLWNDHSDHPQPSEYAAFWYIAYHTLFWLDLYLTGSREDFAPPVPFTLESLTRQVSFPNGPIPGMSYTPIW